MKLYLAGPMTGIPQFNYPAFIDAAKRLRDQGYDIVSPAELDSEKMQAAALQSPDGALVSGGLSGQTWGQILARDVHLIADKVDGIIFLENWVKSRGARLEAFVALLTGKKHFFQYWDGEVKPVPALWVRQMIERNMP